MRLSSILIGSTVLALAIAACSDDDSGGSPDSGGETGGKSATGGKGASTGGKGGAAAGNVGAGGSPEAGGGPGSGGRAQTGGTTGEPDAGTGGNSQPDAGGPDASNPEAGVKFPTLDGKRPLVIGHRGLPGLHPEETQASYDGAVAAGADSLEEDLHLTKDCVLVARHNPWLSDNTNIADVAATNTDIAARKRTVPGRLVNVKYSLATYGGPAQYLTDLTNPEDPKSVLKSLVVDGEDHTNDWSITDFTAAELKSLIKGTTYDARDERPTAENGKFPILTMQEIIDFAKSKSAALGRTLTVYPEAKNPYWNNAQAKANGCGTGDHPFEDAIVKLVKDNGLNTKTSPIILQSFDPASLKYMRSIGLNTLAVQLIDGNDVNYQTGAMVYQTNDVYNFVDGRPYSWTVNGDGRYFDVMFTSAGLDEIKTYADGIGPWKPEVMLHEIVPYVAGGGLGAVNSVTPSSVIADAHAKGLFVHVYTFRNEHKYLAGLYANDPVPEYIEYFAAGVDGVFTDFANTGVAARKQFIDSLSP